MNIENRPKRLLCIVGGMNAGGAETFLMKLYRAINRNEYQMDFYVSIHEEGVYDKEILSMGGRIYKSIPKSKGVIKSFANLKSVVKEEGYEYVMRVSQHSLSTLDLIAAKLGGAKVLVYRSSNSQTGGNKVNKLLHALFKGLSINVPNIKLAPSTEAAEFMFGKNSVKNGEAIIIKNAIPVDRFVFNKAKREELRDEFKIKDKFVIGHVGRFSNQKNHLFLIEVFSELVKSHEDSVLVLVGKGELEDSISRKVAEMGLSEKVIFTGIRADVAELMMLMDVFVFPSFFEGMPNTVIEAQATGLPCIISDTITKEVNITGEVTYLSLEEKKEVWVKVILKYLHKKERDDSSYIFLEKGYDMNQEATKIIQHIMNYN